MNNFEQKRKQRIFEILAMIKIIYILLGTVAMVSSHEIEETNYLVAVVPAVFVLFLTIVYFLWIAYYQKTEKNKKLNTKDILETSLLLIIFIIVLVTTGLESSKYKFLCIFAITIGAIQFNKDYSIAIAIACAAIILGIDIYGSFSGVIDGLDPNQTIIIRELEVPSPDFISIGDILDSTKDKLNEYFEADLVLIGGLLVNSFILGIYVDTEKEHTRQLSALVNIDELTELYNHRYFQDKLNQIIDESDRSNNEVSLLFMDIDHFKHYNDINGHQAGDKILKQIGKILKESMRRNDIVARYGGEEFAAILPNTLEEEAIEIGEKIRETIQNTEFYGQENQPDKNITISIGVSSYPSRAKNKHQFINTADDALYRAKAFNKNRVEKYHNVFEDLCNGLEVEEETIKSLKKLISMINRKDKYTYGHTERVVIYANEFSSFLNLSEKEKMELKISAYLHDMGKVEIPAEVLNKKDRLTDEEFEMLKQHPQLGVNLISGIEQFERFIPIIKHHHEKYNGRGYPDGLKGKEIPYLARILTVIDSFDAMTSNRPYNNRKSRMAGIEELRKFSGSQFDPQIVESFISMLEMSEENL